MTIDNTPGFTITMFIDTAVPGAPSAWQPVTFFLRLTNSFGSTNLHLNFTLPASGQDASD